MEFADIIKGVNELFIEILDETDIVLSKETTASDIDEWDSLNHIQLVVAIEKRFNIRFAAGEVTGFKNVGQMCESIQEKLRQS